MKEMVMIVDGKVKEEYLNSRKRRQKKNLGKCTRNVH